MTGIVPALHALGVEILRWKERDKPLHSPAIRLLIVVLSLAVESEPHAMVDCTGPTLVGMRHAFLLDDFRILPDMPRGWASSHLTDAGTLMWYSA